MTDFLSLPTHPLSKAKRRIIFYLSALLFLMLAPLIVFYSTGYNIDIKNGGFFKSGGIFVKTNHAGFSLFINGELTKESSFISYGALVTGLKPDLYLIRIEKEGFRPWQKFIKVEPETVSEFRFVYLIREAIKEEEVLDLARRNLSIESFTPLNGSPWLLIRTNEKPALTYLFNKSTKFFDAVESFKDFKWDDNNSRFLVHRENPVKFSVVNVTPKRINEEKITLPKILGRVKALEFMPNNRKGYLALSSDNDLYTFNQGNLQANKILSDVHSFSVSQNRILFVTKGGVFGSSDFGGENIVSYGRKGYYLADKAAEMKMLSSGEVYLLDSAGGFFLKLRGQAEVEPVAGDIRGVKFADNEEKVFFWADNYGDVIWLEDEVHQPFRKSGTREKIISFGESINYASWFGSSGQHIIFWAGKFAGLIDIDSRGGGPAASLVLDNISGTMTYLNDTGEILRSEKSLIYQSVL